MKILFIICLLSVAVSAQAQQDKLASILIKTEKALSNIKNGYYEYELYFKAITDSDTSKTAGKFYFNNQNGARKTTSSTTQAGKTYLTEEFYNPKQNYYVLLHDSKKYRQDTTWSTQGDKEMALYYGASEYFGAKALQDTNFSQVSLLADTSLNGKRCYRIKYSYADQPPFSDIYKIVSIDQKSFIPLCFEAHYLFTQLNDPQYSKLQLSKVDFNKKKYQKETAYRPIPADYTDARANIQPRKDIVLGDTLHELIYKNLPNQSIDLDQLKQEYILLDFWYVSCYPCMLASTFVDTLAQQYEDKNLFVVGVNTQDTSESKISDFKKKKNISYPNILMDYQSARKLNVYAYPTFVIIERKSRKVVYLQVGFGEEIKKPMMDFIDKNIAQ